MAPRITARAPHDGHAHDGGEADAADASARVWPLREVAKHNSHDDCWMIIKGKVYDVTSFVRSHPGGPLIYSNAGGDNTTQFSSYHPLYVERMLGKYLVGSVDRASVDDARRTDVAGHVEYVEDVPDDARVGGGGGGRAQRGQGEGDFYRTLKARVEAYFRETKQDPRVHPHMYVKTAVILASHVAAVYGMFYARVPLAAAVAASLLLGLCFTEIGVSIQHDANHGSYGRSPLWGQLLGCTLDMMGISSFNWKKQHVVGHHAHTNVVGADPDVEVLPEGDPRRYHSEHPLRPMHRYQHVYMLMLYCLMGFKLAFVEDFSIYFRGRLGPLTFGAPMNAGEKLVFWAGKAAFAAYMFAMPLALSHRAAATVLLLDALAIAFAGFLLAIMFQVSHVQTRLEFPKPDDRGRVHRGWAENQLMTTADYAHGSSFWLHISGGLNYQVVHHLFPGVTHCHYPALARIVREACEERGITYHVYDTFADALADHVRHLRLVGRQQIVIPSYGNLG